MVLANTRLPEVVGGDLSAQTGACAVGERRLLALIERFGLDRFRELTEAVIAYTERRVRREIAAIPDGVYHGEAPVDSEPGASTPLRWVRVAVTVNGDTIHFDYTGTDPQAPSYVNAPMATTVSVTLLALFMLIDADIPHNEGLITPVTITAPEGCLLNARFPAPTAHGNFTCSDAIPDAIFKALAPVLPDRVTAGWQRNFAGPILGIDPRSRRFYVDTTFLCAKGGSGATRGTDGWSHLGLIGCAGGLRAQDYEMHEVQSPHLVRSSRSPVACKPLCDYVYRSF